MKTEFLLVSEFLENVTCIFLIEKWEIFASEISLIYFHFNYSYICSYIFIHVHNRKFPIFQNIPK